MALLYGRDMTKNEILAHAGNLSQIVDARECVMTSGKAEGVRSIEVKTGSGLCFSVLPSRGMDIAWAEYCGRALGFISRTGVTGPAYLSHSGEQADRSFMGGLLTTCGFSNVGPSSSVGYHGRVSNTPAQDVSVHRYWRGDEYILRLCGKVSEACTMAEDYELTRSLTTHLGAKHFDIEDVVENRAFTPQPFMALWHINFGFPVVSEHTRLHQAPRSEVTPLEESMAGGVADCRAFPPPQEQRPYEVFFHRYERAPLAVACLYNENLEFGAYVRVHQQDFARFMQWKMVNRGDYVCALEPCNAHSLGRDALAAQNELPELAPGEAKHFRYRIGVVEGRQELAALLADTGIGTP